MLESQQEKWATVVKPAKIVHPPPLGEELEAVLERGTTGPEGLPGLLSRINARFGFGGPYGSIDATIEGTEKLNVRAFSVVGRARKELHYQIWSGLRGTGHPREIGRLDVRRIESATRLMQQLEKAGIPIPHLYTASDGSPLFELVMPHSGMGWYARVMDHVRADPLQNPTEGDIAAVSKILARINQAEFEIKRQRDSWAVTSLPLEYRKIKSYLQQKAPEIDRKVSPHVAFMEGIDFTNSDLFPRGVMHGDWQPAHILRSVGGLYWIIDWECANNGPKIIDLANFLAIFCTDPSSLDSSVQRYRTALKYYEEETQLTPQERKILPSLVRADHAIFLLRSWTYWNDPKEPLRTQQIKHWLHYSAKALKITENLGAKDIN